MILQKANYTIASAMSAGRKIKNSIELKSLINKNL